MITSRTAGRSVTAEKECGKDRELSGDVFDPEDGFRQVHLEGVGTPIVRDETRTDIDRHEEREQSLPFDEGLEHPCVHRQDLARLRVHRHRIDLDGPDQKRQPCQEQQAQEHLLRENRAHAGAGDDEPSAPVRLAFALVAAIALVVDRTHRSPTARANTSSSVGRLGRR